MPRVAGLIPPVITPLTADGKVDRAAVLRVMERLVSAGVDGVFVMGSSGEGPSLSDRQRRDVATAYVEASGGRVPVYVGALDPSPERAATTVDMVISIGADAVVLGGPYYFTGAGPEHVRAHVLQSLGGTDVPAIVYNLPQATGNPFTPDVVRHLAADARIVAIKDSCGVEADSLALQAAAAGAGLDFLQGAEALLATSVLHGAAGIIPGAANIVPRLCRRLFDAAASGDVDVALALQADLVVACEAIYRGGHWLSALKATASEFGLCGPATSGGLPPLERGDAVVVEDVVRVAAEDAA